MQGNIVVRSLLGVGMAIWGEARMGAEAAALLASPVWRGSGVPAGASRPVLLIPGFLAGDSSMTLMSSWLKRVGYGVLEPGVE